jgi:hypothetical protein
VSGRSITFGTEFLEGFDWVGTITFDIVNTSGKVITYVEIDGWVANPDNPETRIIVPLARVGSNTGIGGVAATALLKAEEVAHCASATRYDQLPQSLRSKLRDCYRLHLVVNSVMFSDDTRWSKGALLRRDPTNPNRWIRSSSQSSSSQGFAGRLKPVSYSSRRLASHLAGPAQGGYCGVWDVSEYIQCGGFGCYREIVWITPYSSPDIANVPTYIVCEDPGGFGNCEPIEVYSWVFCGAGGPW